MEILWLAMGLLGGVVIGALLNQGKQTATIHDSDIVDISNLTYDDKQSIRYQVKWFEKSYGGSDEMDEEDSADNADSAGGCSHRL